MTGGIAAGVLVDAPAADLPAVFLRDIEAFLRELEQGPASIRAITVMQPWASAIGAGPKRVENRPRRWPTGPYLIHAGKGWDRAAVADPLMDTWLEGPAAQVLPAGQVIGICRITDCHLAGGGCCDDPWGRVPAEPARNFHLVLTQVVALAEPVACSGSRGPWRPPADVVDAVHRQLAALAMRLRVEASPAAPRCLGDVETVLGARTELGTAGKR